MSFATTAAVSLTVLLCLPDRIPMGQKPIAVEAHLRLGALASRCCLQVEVKKGDTLAEIARTRLGDAARATEIEKLNPGLGADGPKPGDKLWLPPTDKANADGAPMLFAGVVWRNGASVAPARLDDDGLEIGKGGTLKLFVVKPAALGDMKAALDGGNRPRDLMAMATTESITVLQLTAPGRTIDRASPIERRVDVFSVAGGGEKFDPKTLSLALESRWLDKDGAECKPPAPADEKPGKRGRDAMPLLLAGLAGGLLLLGRARRAAPALTTC